MNACSFGQIGLSKAGRLECAAKALNEVCNHNRDKSISAYALQAQKHTAIGGYAYKRRRMEKTPDEKREILRQFIKAHGLKIARWAKASGVDKNSLYNFLNGHSKSLDLLTYSKLARTAEEPVWKLTGDTPEPPSPTAVWVVGNIEAGAFKEAVEWDRSLWFSVDVPVPERFRGKAKALQVRGPSMNVDYPDGSIAVWVDALDYRSPRHGDDVVVYSYANDDGIEATLKELRIDDQGRRWLWPRSHDPMHQAPLEIGNPPAPVKDIEIKGIVIGCYRQWHH